MENIDPNQAVDFLLKNAGLFAKAKAQRIYLEEFRKSKKALLMQEAFMAGVAEDSITGDIPEEHEVETRHIIERADGSSLVDGRTEISALESELGIAVPSDARFHTVAGLALEIFGRIPREGDVA